MAKRTSKKTTRPAPQGKDAAKPKARAAKTTTPRLLSGGNPQIAKAVGDAGPAAVRAYIAAVPGWKSNTARRLDALIERAVPGVREAIKWNSPLYGAPDQEGTWFLGIHCFAKYIKVAFFRGASLRPLPPDESKQKEVRYLNVHEGWGNSNDEAQFTSWVKQASQQPGEKM